MRHSTKLISEKLSQKEVKTAKHFTVELVFMEQFQQEWVLNLPVMLRKIVLCSRM
jgi:hypothetical protein